MRGVRDEVDCDHDWVLVQVEANMQGATLIHECAVCGATSFEPSSGDEAAVRRLRDGSGS